MKNFSMRTCLIFILCVIAAMILYSTIIILPVKAENTPHATFWIEIVSVDPSYPGSVTIRLHPEGCYATNGEIVDYEWTFNSLVPQVIHKTTSDSFEYTFPRYGGNYGAMYGLEGKTITLTVTDSNGSSDSFSQVVPILPRNIVPEVPFGSIMAFVAMLSGCSGFYLVSKHRKKI